MRTKRVLMQKIGSPDRLSLHVCLHFGALRQKYRDFYLPLVIGPLFSIDRRNKITLLWSYGLILLHPAKYFNLIVDTKIQRRILRHETKYHPAIGEE